MIAFAALCRYRCPRPCRPGTPPGSARGTRPSRRCNYNARDPPPPEDPSRMPVPVVEFTRRAPAQRPAPDRRGGPPRARGRRQRLVQRRLEARGRGQDRLRPPVRARDVPGLARTSARRSTWPLVQAVGGMLERDDVAGPHQLLRDGAQRTSWSWRSGSRRTGWARCSRPSSQENLDNQRDVVKNEKRWSYDNRPYGSWTGEGARARLPSRPPVPPPDDRVDGDLDAASLEDVKAFFATYYAPNNAVLSVVGRLRPGAGARVGRAVLRADPGQPRRSRRCRT